MSLLLAIIYLTFVSLGLPDSALGSAWPSMYGELGAGISWAGVISAIVCAGTIVSSVLSTNIVRKLGTGKTCAISTGLTAVALLGYASCTSFWQLCLWAIPYGLGAGAIDAALNSYAAINFPARHMSWLHCMWGVGASVGPAIMSWRLAEGTWHGGFAAIGAIQLAITAIIALSLPMWKRGKALEDCAEERADGSDDNARFSNDETPRGSNGASETTPSSDSAPTRSRRELLAAPGVCEILICFFCYCALETTCGQWAASYCTLQLGVDANTAAGWASLFYLGITAGRAVSGFLTWRLSDKNLIRLGQLIIACGLALIALPLPPACSMAGLVLCGLGCAPVYPSIIHCTPAYFGQEFTLALSGMQMAFAYVGSLVMSPLFGVLAQAISPALYPFYLIILLVLMTWMSESLNRKVASRQA